MLTTNQPHRLFFIAFSEKNAFQMPFRKKYLRSYGNPALAPLYYYNISTKISRFSIYFDFFLKTLLKK